MSHKALLIIAITLIMSSNLFSSSPLSDENERTSKTSASMQTIFSNFFSGKLNADTIEKLDGKTFLSFMIENMYNKITDSIKNEECSAILKALKEQNIINPQTERITKKYAEDYSVTFDKFIGYDFIDQLKGPKKLGDYFKQYYKKYKIPEDTDEELSD